MNSGWVCKFGVYRQIARGAANYDLVTLEVAGTHLKFTFHLLDHLVLQNKQAYPVKSHLFSRV